MPYISQARRNASPATVVSRPGSPPPVCRVPVLVWFGGDELQAIALSGETDVHSHPWSSPLSKSLLHTHASFFGSMSNNMLERSRSDLKHSVTGNNVFPPCTMQQANRWRMAGQHGQHALSSYTYFQDAGCGAMEHAMAFSHAG